VLPTSPSHDYLRVARRHARLVAVCDLRRGSVPSGIRRARRSRDSALVRGGEIYSMVKNQEYKRAFGGHGHRGRRALGGIEESRTRPIATATRASVASARPMAAPGRLTRPQSSQRCGSAKASCTSSNTTSASASRQARCLRMLAEPTRRAVALRVEPEMDVRFIQAAATSGLRSARWLWDPYVQIQGQNCPSNHRPFDRGECDVWWKRKSRAAATAQTVTTGLHRGCDWLGAPAWKSARQRRMPTCGRFAAAAVIPAPKWRIAFGARQRMRREILQREGRLTLNEPHDER